MSNNVEIIRRLPYNPKLKERARVLRKNMTTAEKKIRFNYFQGLQKNNLNNKKIRILKQRPIWDFIVDFYIPSLKLIVEIDWDSHFTKEAIDYDIERTLYLEWLWLHVIRFTNDDVMKNFDWVCQELYKFIK